MARVPTVDEVRQIISTGLSDSDVSAVITDAALLVEHCVESFEDDRAATIVKYVTADLIASTISTRGRGPLQSKSLGDASESWAANSAGAEFGKSAYWNKALLYDLTGCLLNLGKRVATLEKI